MNGIIDNLSWVEFHLVGNNGILKHDHGQRLKILDRRKGDTPLITAGSFNNGVADYISPPNKQKKFSNCLTIDMFGKCFWQEGEFVCDDNIYPIIGIANKYVGMFLCTIIEKSISFSFGKQFREKELLKIKISMPIDSQGKPNWKAMEEYMKSVERDTNKSINQLLPNNIQLSCQWKKFKIHNYFVITGSKTTSLPILKRKAGTHPYVTTQATNNGIAGYFSVFTEKGNVLCVDSAVGGWMTYQDKDFSASDHVEKLIPKFNLTKNIALFICSIWNKLYAFSKYSYALKASQMQLKKESIILPMKNDSPDWEYMENYMKQLSKY